MSLPLPTGPALDRPTILAIRLRVIQMYEGLEALFTASTPESLYGQARGMRSVRSMLGRMLDEQAGIIPPENPPAEHAFDLAEHLRRQRTWSYHTFGPGPRSKGVIDHIRKELSEIEANPTDLEEWIDVIILAFDGAARAGHSPEDVIAALVAKQAKNESRQWPDWKSQPTDKAICHIPSASQP